MSREPTANRVSILISRVKPRYSPTVTMYGQYTFTSKICTKLEREEYPLLSNPKMTHVAPLNNKTDAAETSNRVRYLVVINAKRPFFVARRRGKVPFFFSSSKSPGMRTRMNNNIQILPSV